MLANGLIHTYNLPENVDSLRQEDLIPTLMNKTQRFKYNQKVHIPRIQHTHSPFSPVFRNRRIIFLVRDLRDALVSHYRVVQPHFGLPKDFSAFIRGETIDPRHQHDLKSRIKLLNSWTDNFKKTAEYKVVRYEDLRNNTTSELREIFKFAGIPKIDTQFLNNIIKSASFSEMKKLENSFGSNTRSQKITGNPSSYKDYFSIEDQKYFLSHVQNELHDWFGYDYLNW